MEMKANGVNIEVEVEVEVEDTGAALAADGTTRPVVMLIMGLGMQLIAWPMDLVQALVEAGYRVVRFDNRDIGLSQHFDKAGVPNILWAGLKTRLGLPVRAAYSLTDMANDAIDVLDALKIANAHIMGVSMGGMIAQRIALSAPQRCLCLTSIMSTSGARGLQDTKPHVVSALIRRPAIAIPKSIGDFYVKLINVIESPDFPVPEAEVRARAVIAFKRRYHPQGMMAIMADTGRANELKNVTVPTLVLHGTEDVLVPFACGRDTAKRIPNSKFVPIKGMGHNLPPGVVERLLVNMIPHFEAV
jgi:pimeloyl-ACP methyl ester carboxylesterase